jgi:lipopolysaccharide/colanic/teichoic acid biosynthesis glycosyltransferase
MTTEIHDEILTEGHPVSWAKRGIDLGVASILLLAASPVILLAMLAVRLTSKGSAIYRQRRVGRHGTEFVIYKIRTMFQDCESHSGIRWATKTDPRVTPVGRFLRNTHLDELPQLWNVLRGDMSLIGPRPERPEIVPSLELALPSYRDRLLVRPGLSGLAQVQLPADTDLESVGRKLACDLYYVRHWSLGLELRLVACTVMYLTGVPFRRSGRWFAIPSHETIDEAERRDEAMLHATPSGRVSGLEPCRGRTTAVCLESEPIESLSGVRPAWD